MGVLGVMRDYALARFRPGSAVRRLVAALGSGDEDTSTAAYMALVKLGPRIAPCLLEEAHKGVQTADVLQVLGDLDDRNLIPELERFANSNNSEIAAAARESLQSLQEEEEEDI